MKKKEIIELYQKEDIAKEFDPDRKKYYYQRYKHYFEAKILKNVIKKYPSNSLKILDVACGTGRMLPEVFKTSKEISYVGLDTSESMKSFLRAKAKSLGRDKEIKLVNADATKIPFKDNSFDIVFTYHLLWHIPEKDQKLIVKEMLRVTKEGGIIIFDILNKKFVFDSLKKLIGRGGREGIHKLNISEVRGMVEGKRITQEKLLDIPIKNAVLYSIINLINNLNKIFPRNLFHMLYFIVQK